MWYQLAANARLAAGLYIQARHFTSQCKVQACGGVCVQTSSQARIQVEGEPRQVYTAALSVRHVLNVEQHAKSAARS